MILLSVSSTSSLPVLPYFTEQELAAVDIGNIETSLQVLNYVLASIIAIIVLL